MQFLLRPLLVLGAACTLVVSLSAQSVRVLSVSGEATVQFPGESAPRAVRKGDTIVVGTRIITSEGARVILTPLPGVNSIIAPNSEVVIESVSAPAADSGSRLHSAVLGLKSGAVTTDLKTTPGVELDYGVRTARGLAAARGTTYTVGVNAAGIQTIVVADGAITLTLADGRVVNLVPGQISITRTDGSTQAVSSASDLSTGDQAIAENWVETTLEALLEAVGQGADIDPAALQDAARAARELGIEIDPATQSRIDGALESLARTRAEALVAAIKQAPAEERAGLVEAALAATPGLAPALIEALISAFPREAEAYTKLVLDSILGADLPSEAKGALLTEIGRKAVQAALQIPPTSVDNLLATINGVKAVLAAIPPEFRDFVAAYTLPLTRLPETLLIINPGDGLPTQTILSDDTL